VREFAQKQKKGTGRTDDGPHSVKNRRRSFSHFFRLRKNKKNTMPRGVGSSAIAALALALAVVNAEVREREVIKRCRPVARAHLSARPFGKTRAPFRGRPAKQSSHLSVFRKV
jgi:hypothetical protein